MSSSEEESSDVSHVSLNWDDHLEWERQVEAEEKAKLAQQREEEEKEQTKSSAAKDLLEALQEEQILDDLEIKQEIVLDPNEWVLAWILLDWSRVLNEFILYFSDSHSQPRAKTKLRDHSSATFAEIFSNPNLAFELISPGFIWLQTSDSSAKFAGKH